MMQGRTMRLPVRNHRLPEWGWSARKMKWVQWRWASSGGFRSLMQRPRAPLNSTSAAIAATTILITLHLHSG